MPKTAGQKLKLLALLTYLQENADEAHPVTLQQMIDYLYTQGISAERKSIYSDLACLQDFGYAIAKKKERSTGYYLTTRIFTLNELKLLGDCIASSKFIPLEKTEELADKLGRLTSRYHARKLKRQIYVKGRKKNGSDDIYLKVDSIHAAIDQRVQLTFQYREYTTEKKKVFRQSGKAYTVSPYAVTFDQENYYLLAYHEKYQNIASFRVDKMENIHTTSQPLTQVEFDLHNYLAQSFSMFSGDPITMTLECSNTLISVMIDRFGEDISIKKQTDKTFTLTVPVVPSPAFWGWLFQMGSQVKLRKPKTAVNAYKNQLKAVKKLYKD